MPSKRYEKRTIDYLTCAEIEALIGSADRTCCLAAEMGPCFCSPCRPGFESQI